MNPLPDLDEAVLLAIAEWNAWKKRAAPSEINPQPRVAVFDGSRLHLRRPFKKCGRWCVRLTGTARLTRPHRSTHGDIQFIADWGRLA